MFDKERFEESIYYTLFTLMWLFVIVIGGALCVLLDIWLHVAIIVGSSFTIWLIVYIVMTVNDSFKERRN